MRNREDEKMKKILGLTRFQSIRGRDKLHKCKKTIYLVGKTKTKTKIKDIEFGYKIRGKTGKKMDKMGI